MGCDGCSRRRPRRTGDPQAPQGLRSPRDTRGKAQTGARNVARHGTLRQTVPSSSPKKHRPAGSPAGRFSFRMGLFRTWMNPCGIRPVRLALTACIRRPRSGKRKCHPTSGISPSPGRQISAPHFCRKWQSRGGGMVLANFSSIGILRDLKSNRKGGDLPIWSTK
jgi:hypothetical protein